MYNGLATPNYSAAMAPPLANRSYLYNPSRWHTGNTQRSYYDSAPRLLTNKRTSYSGPCRAEDNHLTDYGFAPWLTRPKTACGFMTQMPSEKRPSLSLARPQYAPSNIAWNTNLVETNSNEGEILHV